MIVRIFWQTHCSRSTTCSYKKTARLVRTFWNSCHLNVNFFWIYSQDVLLCVLHRPGESLAWWKGQWEQSWGEVTKQEEGNCKSEASCSGKGLVAALVTLISSSFNVWGSLSPCLFRAEVEGAVTANRSHQERVVLYHQLWLPGLTDTVIKWMANT